MFAPKVLTTPEIKLIMAREIVSIWSVMNFSKIAARCTILVKPILSPIGIQMVAKNIRLFENAMFWTKTNPMVIQHVFKGHPHMFSIKIVSIFVLEMAAITIQMLIELIQDWTRTAILSK